MEESLFTRDYEAPETPLSQHCGSCFAACQQEMYKTTASWTKPVSKPFEKRLKIGGKDRYRFIFKVRCAILWPVFEIERKLPRLTLLFERVSTGTLDR